MLAASKKTYFIEMRGSLTWSQMLTIRPYSDLADLFSVLYIKVYFGPPLWSSDQSSWLLNGDVLCFL
jgi:hypothetical protein